MTKIMLTLCTFGVLMGIIFPIYANMYIEWIPGKKAPFVIGCIIAGFLVGMFGFLILKAILKKIDNHYKRILFSKLNLTQFRKEAKEKDLLLSMKNEFDELLNIFDTIRKNEENRLKELSITDCLTTVYNHRHFHDFLQAKKMSDCKRMIILFCDIDNFKKVNDTYGHVVGDSILKNVANIIKNQLSESNNIFRYGGEEFVVALEDSTINKAFELAEKIRLDINSTKFSNGIIHDIYISVSIGVASYPEHTKDIEDLLDKADKAMYYAKQNGKNQCRIYKRELDEQFEVIKRKCK